MVPEETTVDIIVLSIRQLGFPEGEFVPLGAIYDRAKQLGLQICPVETAAQLRLQFLDQPNYRTGDRLGEFFVASEPFTLTRVGSPQIFSVVRDDDFPHIETDIGLWLIVNNAVQFENGEFIDRKFNITNFSPVDHEGRFAFIIPK